MAPFIQAFDCLLMLAGGIYCLRSNREGKSKMIRLLALACFVSAVILLGFFLSATYYNQPLLPLSPQARQLAYVVARLLAPFELLLFAAAIILVARRHRGIRLSVKGRAQAISNELRFRERNTTGDFLRRRLLRGNPCNG